MWISTASPEQNVSVIQSLCSHLLVPVYFPLCLSLSLSGHILNILIGLEAISTIVPYVPQGLAPIILATTYKEASHVWGRSQLKALNIVTSKCGQ